MDSDFMMMSFVNLWSSNLVTVLKNFTLNTLYGVSAANANFIVTPDEVGDQIAMANYICVNTHYNFNNAQQSGHSAFQYKVYMVPQKGRPLYVPEFNIVLFATVEERADALRRFGTGLYIIESYASHMLPLMNGAYKVTCCLSEKPYFGVFNREVHELPRGSQEYTNEAMTRHNITQDMLQTSDVFVVETVLKHVNLGAPNTLSHEVKVVDRNELNPSEPIIFGNTGIVLFPTREAAQSWVTDYDASTENYLIDKAFEVVEDAHRQDLEDFVKETKEDKQDMAGMFLAIGGSGIAGVLVDALLKLVVERANQNKGGPDVLPGSGAGRSSSIGPTIGVIAGIAVIGVIAYFIWKANDDKKKDEERRKQERRRQKLYKSTRRRGAVYG
jgi:hypothetical protein